MKNKVSLILIIVGAIWMMFVPEGFFAMLVPAALVVAGVLLSGKTVVSALSLALMVAVLFVSCGGGVEEIIDGNYSPENATFSTLLVIVAVGVFLFIDCMTEKQIAKTDKEICKKYHERFGAFAEGVNFCFMSRYDSSFAAIGLDEAVYFFWQGNPQRVPIEELEYEKYIKYDSTYVKIYQNHIPCRDFHFLYGQTDRFIACIDYIKNNPAWAEFEDAKNDPITALTDGRAAFFLDRFKALCQIGGIDPEIYDGQIKL